MKSLFVLLVAFAISFVVITEGAQAPCFYGCPPSWICYKGRCGQMKRHAPTFMEQQNSSYYGYGPIEKNDASF